MSALEDVKEDLERICAEGDVLCCAALKCIRELETAQGVAVTPGVLERNVWSAMVWARENPSPDEVPEYTDGGNSFAEKECRAAVQRIRSALAGQGGDP